MKRYIAIIGACLLLCAALSAQAGAVQVHHKPIHCKKGTHRNGKKCVTNQHPVQVIIVPGPTGPQGVSGSAGQAGTQGPAGQTGATGPEGAPAPVNPLLFDNITPESRIDNPVSLGYAATGTTQFGSQISLGREGGVTDPTVEVLMSSWTCEQGEWNAGCVTAAPSTYSTALTLNVYAVAFENQAGELITSDTSTFAIPYRPSADPTCPSATQYRATDGKCFNGLPAPVSFHLAGTLPHNVIVTVEFNPAGPTNSLNVGLEGPPTVGQNPLSGLEGIYWDSSFYGSGTFGLEEQSEFSPGEQLAARIVG